MPMRLWFIGHGSVTGLQSIYWSQTGYKVAIVYESQIST